MCFKVSSLMLEAFKLFEETGICRFSLSFASQGYTEGKERTLRWVPTQTADCSLCGTNSLPLSCCFPVVRIKDLTVLLRVQSSLAGLLCRRCLRGLLAESLPGRGTLQVSITVWLSLGNTTTWSWFGLNRPFHNGDLVQGLSALKANFPLCALLSPFILFNCKPSELPGTAMSKPIKYQSIVSRSGTLLYHQ